MAYLWREISVSKLIRLVLFMDRNLPFLLCFTLYLRVISKYKPPGGLILMEGFLRYKFGRAYTRRGLFSEFYGIVMFCSFVIETVITSHELFSVSSLLLIILKLFIGSPNV